MDIQLTDKRALISGFSKHIGFMFTKLLAAEGAEIIFNGRHSAAVEQAVSDIFRRIPGAKVQSFIGDLIQDDVAKTLFEKFPAIDILVNNLGIFEPKPSEDITDGDWQRFF